MAKRAPAKQPARRSPAARQPAREPERQPSEQRPPFLKSTDIGNVAELEVIQGTVRSLRGRFGDQIVTDVRCRGRVYSWGVNVSSPNIRLLVQSLVDSPGEPVKVKTMISQQGRPFIAVDSSEQPANDDDIPF